MAQRLPPDHDNLNHDRAVWAGNALATFMQQTGTDQEGALCDLLADVMRQPNRFPLSPKRRAWLSALKKLTKAVEEAEKAK